MLWHLSYKADPRALRELFSVHRIAAGHYAVHLRVQPWSLVGDVLRVAAGSDRGFWRAVVWSEEDDRFTAQSAAAFTYRLEAIEFLARYHAKAKERAA